MTVSMHRRSSQRLELLPNQILPCVLLDHEGLTLAAGEIRDLSERGLSIRLASRNTPAARGTGLLVRSLLPGTGHAMRRFGLVANARTTKFGEVWGVGWSDAAPCGPTYSNLQRWRYEAYLRKLREGKKAGRNLRDLLSMLDERIVEERRSLLAWVRGSSVALETLCAESERERQVPLVKPSRWHEEMFELLDPRFPRNPCHARILERGDCGFVALVAVDHFPRTLMGRELWALHRGLSPGMRRCLSVSANELERVCRGLYRVSFSMLDRNAVRTLAETLSPAATAVSQAG